MTSATQEPATRAWRPIVAKYQRSLITDAVIQMATTLIPLGIAFYVMYQLLGVSVWLTLLLAIPTGGFLVRTFMIMHDCAHGSFLPSKRANSIIGWITGLLTVTPFPQWRHDHAVHHASSGDLTRRGHGDIDTLTVREYLSRSPVGRLKYRLSRHPVLLFGVGPTIFLVQNRLPPRGPMATPRMRMGVWLVNAILLALFSLASWWIGWRAVAIIYAPSMYFAATVGIWLFYVQHQFEETYWKEHQEWDYATAAIRGSSYLRLHPVLRWFTANIGLHHVHHLGPRIPNYALQRAHDENPLFHDSTVLTFMGSMRTLRLTLWDEDRQQLVGFRDIVIPRPLPVRS